MQPSFGQEERPSRRRVQALEKKKRDKGIIRVGDNSENQDHNQMNQMQMQMQLNHQTANQFAEKNLSFLGLYSWMGSSSHNSAIPNLLLPSGSPAPVQTSNHPPPVSYPVTTQNLKRTREQSLRRNSNYLDSSRPTFANPIPPENSISNTQPKATWQVPIDVSNQAQPQGAHEDPFPSFLPLFKPAKDENQNLGIDPRKMSQPTPNPFTQPQSSLNSPIIPQPLPPRHQAKGPINICRPPNVQQNILPPVTQNFESSKSISESSSHVSNPAFVLAPINPTAIQLNNQNANNPFPITNVHSQLNPMQMQSLNLKYSNQAQQNAFANPSQGFQYSLGQYLQSQLANNSSQLRETMKPVGAKVRKICHSFPQIPSSQSRFFQNLNVHFPISEQDIIKSENFCEFSQSQRFHQIDDCIKYFINREACKNKTKNIYLILERLEEAVDKFEENITLSLPQCTPNTKIKDAKALIPYLASIKRWYESIKLSSSACNQQLQKLQRRNAQIHKIQEKLTNLKRSAYQIKISSSLLKATSSTCQLIAKQAKFAFQLSIARNLNSRSYTYTYPDDELVNICALVLRNYQDMLEKMGEYYLIQKGNWIAEDEGERIPSKASVLKQLIERLMRNSGDLSDLQSQVARLRAKKVIKAKVEECVRVVLPKQWKMFNSFREIQLIVNRKKLALQRE